MEQAEGLEEHCSEVVVAKLLQRSCCGGPCIPNGAGWRIGGALQQSCCSKVKVSAASLMDQAEGLLQSQWEANPLESRLKDCCDEGGWRIAVMNDEGLLQS